MRALLTSLVFAPLASLTKRHGEMGWSIMGRADDNFLPFDKFLDQVKRAEYKDYSKTFVKNETAFEEMREHVLLMYSGITDRSKVSSFVQDGQYGDCILVKEQPTVHLLNLTEIAKPPSGFVSAPKDGTAPNNGSYAESPLKQGLKDKYGNAIACPAESIPMARLSLEQITRFPTLLDFFSKYQYPQTNATLGKRADSATHLWAFGSQWVDNFGGNSWLNLWNPKAAFSISQQWYVGLNGSDPQQTLEGGWTVNKERQPNSDLARLFIFWTADNYKNAKCWNLDCAAFVQINHNWFIGGIWDHYSTIDGQQWGFELQWKKYKSNWWMFLKGPGSYEAVGYYPDSIYNGGQLSRNATLIEYGGEVANITSGFGEMGSGHHAAEGWAKAAYQRTIFWIPRNEDGGVGEWTNLNPAVIGSPKCYSIDLKNAPNGGNWGTHFYYGGPGGQDCAV